MIRPPSRCPRCGSEIAWYDNVPVLSWLVLRGKCRTCALPISPVYPLVELVVALIWVASALHFGPTITALRFAMFSHGAARRDAHRRGGVRDPRRLHRVRPGVGDRDCRCSRTCANDVSLFATPGDAVFGACVGAGAIAIIGWLGEDGAQEGSDGLRRHDAHGDGGRAHRTGPLAAHDLPRRGGGRGGRSCWSCCPSAGLRSKRPGTPYEPPLVPFGIFLAPGAVIALLWGADLVRWYRSGVMGL